MLTPAPPGDGLPKVSGSQLCPPSLVILGAFGRLHEPTRCFTEITRGQAARRRRLRNAAISFAGVMLLGMLGLCIDNFVLCMCVYGSLYVCYQLRTACHDPHSSISIILVHS